MRHLVLFLPLKIRLVKAVEHLYCLIRVLNVSLRLNFEGMGDLRLNSSHNTGQGLFGQLGDVSLEEARCLFEKVQIGCQLRIDDDCDLYIVIAIQGIAHEQDDKASQHIGQNYLEFRLKADVFFIDVFLGEILEVLNALKDNTLQGFHGNQIFLLHLLLQTMVGDSLFIVPDDLVKLLDQLFIQVQLVFGMS